jgi:hypothetical protein
LLRDEERNREDKEKAIGRKVHRIQRKTETLHEILEDQDLNLSENEMDILLSANQLAFLYTRQIARITDT